jgi:hypothetical protein
MVYLLSSDTEEALELLSLSPVHDPDSPLLELHSSFGSDLYDDWPESNDMAASVHVALTAYALSFHMSTVSAPHCTQTLSLIAHLLDSPVHKLLHLKNLNGRSLYLLVLPRANRRR